MISHDSSTQCALEAVNFFQLYLFAYLGRTEKFKNMVKDVEDKLCNLVRTSQEQVLRESALYTLYRLKSNREFVWQNVESAIWSNTNVGLIPLEIAMYLQMYELAELIAARLSDDDPEIRIVCATFIGLNRIEGHEDVLATLLNDDRNRHTDRVRLIDTWHDGFSEYEQCIAVYDSNYDPWPYFHFTSPGDAAQYALERLK